MLGLLVLFSIIIALLASSRLRTRGLRRRGGQGREVTAHLRAWPAGRPELAAPGDLVVSDGSAWWFPPGSRAPVALPGLRVLNLVPARGVARLRGRIGSAQVQLADGTRLGFGPGSTSAAGMVAVLTGLASSVRLAAARPLAPSHRGRSAWAPAPWLRDCLVAGAVGLALVAGLGAFGRRTTALVVGRHATLGIPVDEVAWTGPWDGLPRVNDVLDPTPALADALGAKLEVLVWPPPLSTQAWQPEVAVTALRLALAVMGLAVLTWAVAGLRDWSRARSMARLGGLGVVAGIRVTEAWEAAPVAAGPGAAASQAVRATQGARADLDRPAPSQRGRGMPGWSQAVLEVGQAARAQRWDQAAGRWPARIQFPPIRVAAAVGVGLLLMATLALLVPPVLAMAGQAARTASGEPVQVITAQVESITARPGWTQCRLVAPAGSYVAPCRDTVPGQWFALAVPPGADQPDAAARIKAAGYDATTRRLMVLAGAAALLLVALLALLLPPLRRGRMLRRIAEDPQGVTLRYLRLRQAGGESLLLFEPAGDPPPRWLLHLPGPLPAEVPLAGLTRLAAEIGPGQWSPAGGQWAVALIAGRAAWPDRPLVDLAAGGPLGNSSVGEGWVGDGPVADGWVGDGGVGGRAELGWLTVAPPVNAGPGRP